MAFLRDLAPFILAVVIAAVTVGCSSSSSPPPSISVSLSPSAPQTIDQGQTVAITATVMNNPAGGGISWTLTGPGSLSNQSGLSVTYNSPTSKLTSSRQATVTATSTADKTKTASVQITVNPPLQIPFQSLPNGSVGVPYSQTIAVSGGTAPFQWSIYDGPILTGSRVGGSLPDGLALDANTATISGTPGGGGTWFFEVVVTDAVGATFENGFFSIQINSTAPPQNPVPFLNQTLVPASVSPGSAALPLNVSGTGFLSGATVNFNGVALATTFLDSDHLTALLPAADIATAGTASVTVANPAPGGGPSNVVYFQVQAPEATVTFANAPNSPMPISEPLALSAADFNEDGKPDLAIAANLDVYVLLGNSNGTFTPAAGSPMPMPSPPYDDEPSPYTGPMAVGDFNNSGHAGLAVAEINNQAAVILLGNGDGTFAPSTAAFANALGMPTSSVAAADFNADGNLDLAIANEFSGQSPVVLGYGNGAFSAAGDLFTGIFPIGVAVGDFNADGMLDVVVASGGTTVNPVSGLAVSLGKGNGSFTLAAGSPISLGTNLSAIVTGDFNGDGKLDLAVTDYGSNAVIVVLGNGNGTFGSPTTIPVGNEPDAIITGDFNGDGKLDLAVVNYGDGTITLLLGNGDGTFAPASGSPYAGGRGPTAIASR